MQGQKVAEEEFPAELCYGNCGWKLRGSFRILPVIQCEPHKLDYVNKQQEMVVAESSRLQLGEEVQALAKENCLGGKTIRREHGQTKRFSKFKLSRRKTVLIGPTNIRSKKSPFTDRSTRVQMSDRQKQFGMERSTDIEARKKTLTNKEVHKWVQKHNFRDNQEKRFREERGEANMKLQVYKRIGSTNLRREGRAEGIIFREQGSTRKQYEPFEYTNKLKGVQQHESGLEAESEQGMFNNRAWARGESSNKEDEDRLDLIPIATEVDTSSERSSLMSKGSFLSTTSKDIWETIREAILEEQTSLWLLRNILVMGERLGLSLEGRKESVLNLAHEI